jgi:hypothetical protein
MVLDTKIDGNVDGNAAKDLVDSMQWAVSKYPAQKYFLVLWDHGIGIIDPIWGKVRPDQKGALFNIDTVMAQTNPRIQIDGITIDCHSKEHRGILFNEYSRTYMTNYILTSALEEIKTKVLNNKKLDVLGMDACLMAMLEVSYQTRKYAQYLVASEEVELAHGWNYAAVMGALSGGKVTPAQIAQSIVKSYELYYKDKIQFYTQSAIDLQLIENIKQNLDSIIILIKKCSGTCKSLLVKAIKTARHASLQFSAPNYIDMHSFYAEFEGQLDALKSQYSEYAQNFSDIRQMLEIGTKLIEESVVASTAGKFLPRAKGLSIYFPQSNSIDYSYAKTEFASESLWIDFLKEAIA